MVVRVCYLNQTVSTLSCSIVYVVTHLVLMRKRRYSSHACRLLRRRK